MVIEAVVMKEWKDRPYRSKQGIEVTSHVLTLIESGPSPMLQLIDYNLGPEELGLFGSLRGKRVTLYVNNVRAIFSGRVRVDGALVLPDGNKPK